MAEGLTLSDVADTKYRRYPKYPHWPLVQAAPVTGGPNTEYELSLNDSGNMLYITTNNNDEIGNNIEEQQPVFDQYNAPNQTSLPSNNFGHVSPRKWHHGDIRKDLMHEYHVRQYNKRNTADDIGQRQSIKSNPNANNGQITIYYNGLDFVEGLTNGTETDQVNERELSRDRNLEITSDLNKTETNYDQLKREYLNKSRAKELQYSWLKKNGSRETNENNTRAVIRYDIEIPAYSTMQQSNSNSQEILIDNRILHKAQEDIKALKKECGENSNPQSASASMTLPKFGAKFPRNTRFGSQGKVTAYRPSTRLDNHRQKLHDIMESPVNDIDIAEGKQLWAEVDAVTREPLVPSPLPGRRKQYKSRDTHTSNNSIEFFPLFDREPRKFSEIQNNLQYHDNENVFEPKTYSHDERRNILDPSKSPKAINVENDGRRRPRERLSLNDEQIRQDKLRKDGSNVEAGIRRFASVPVVQLRDEYGNVTYVDQTRDTHRVGRNGNRHFMYPRNNSGSHEPFIHVPGSGACKGTNPRMTTTLPRITPANTPLPPGVCQSNPPRSHSSASMYGAYPPKDLSSSVDFLKVPGRINPLAPPAPRKRINWSWETTNQHWENEKRRILMQKREHTRYHSAWSKAFYGAPAEKEAYRRHFRDVLKQQMADREKSRKDEMINKVKETERAVKYDEQCRSNDAQEYFRKHAYLMLYRDGNKQQMEDKWAETRFNKVSEDRVDRERLRYNPINWSCSLK